MHKKIFAVCFLLSCCFLFIETQKHFADNGIEITKIADKETELEKAFPYKDSIKEIYGFSNRFFSPKEKISGKTATIKDSDGFLEPINSVDISVVDNAKSKIDELNEVCHQNGTEFSFIFYPSKQTYSETVTSEYGVETNYAAIRRDFSEYLDNRQIDHLDISFLLKKDGFGVKDIFYKTDHHWKTTAGLYGARAITDYLNDKYGWTLKADVLTEDKFEYTTYENIWFGETGRSLSRTWVNALDDFVLISPEYDTSVSLLYPDGNESSGDFSIMVDTDGYNNNERDYYSYSAHYSYSRGMGSPMTYHNNLADDNGKKILIIQDSFSVVVIPFLILSTSDITVWDMRKEATKEGLYQYIADNNFDVVLLAYTDFWRSDMWNFN